MHVLLQYGQSCLEVCVPDSNVLSILEPRRASSCTIEAALAEPIASPRLRERARRARSVVILTSDITRPCPTAAMLPPVVQELNNAGIDDRNITVVFGLGTHRPHTGREQEQLTGTEMYRRLRCLDSDPEQVVRLGVTKRGTPIEVFEPVVQADFRIALGVVELHYFAGYSGGAKALMPGVCSKRSIQANHSMMLQPNACAGALVGNPVREDIEEAAAWVGVDFIVNTLVDGEHRARAAVAGDVLAAHRRACQWLDAQSKVELEQAADIALVSAGGFPKDLNLYQAQKALENAAGAVRAGGIILLVAECREGLGNTVFADWLTNYSPAAMIARIQKEFVLGGHKAVAIARVLANKQVYLVSQMPASQVQACGIHPFADLQSAIASAMTKLGPRTKIVIIPHGGSVLPVLRQDDPGSSKKPLDPVSPRSIIPAGQGLT